VLEPAGKGALEKKKKFKKKFTLRTHCKECKRSSPDSKLKELFPNNISSSINNFRIHQVINDKKISIQNYQLEYIYDKKKLKAGVAVGACRQMYFK